MPCVVALSRKVLKDITLPDGTFIPKGTILAAASHPTHHDNSHYHDANTFDPFRFSRMRDGEGEGTKHQFTNTSPENMYFGHGRHAWWADLFALVDSLLTSSNIAPDGSSRPASSRQS